MSFEEEMMSKDKDMSTYSFEPNRGYYLNHRNIFLQWSEQNVSLRAYHKYSPVLEGAYSKK